MARVKRKEGKKGGVYIEDGDGVKKVDGDGVKKVDGDGVNKVEEVKKNVIKKRTTTS